MEPNALFSTQKADDAAQLNTGKYHFRRGLSQAQSDNDLATHSREMEFRLQPSVTNSACCSSSTCNILEMSNEVRLILSENAVNLISHDNQEVVVSLTSKYIHFRSLQILTVR